MNGSAPAGWAPTVWQSMSGINRHLMEAKPILPALIALLYGIYKFFDLGISSEHYLYTYIPAVGALASIVSIKAYSATVQTNKRSVFGALGALCGFVPYVFSLYLMAVLGLHGIWQSIAPVSIWGIVAGGIWVVLGYRLLRKFWIITELAWLPANEENILEILVSNLGMKPRDVALALSDEHFARLGSGQVPEG